MPHTHTHTQSHHPYLFKIATVLSLESTRATEPDPAIKFFWASSIARTIGKDMLTKEPSSSRSELKWSVWRNWDSFIKPLSGLAQPSLSTWTHSRSTRDSFIRAKEDAICLFTSFSPSFTISSTSFPPSGSINPDEIRVFGRVLGCDRVGRENFNGEMKWAFWVSGKEWNGFGALINIAAMVAIGGCFKLSLCFCKAFGRWLYIIVICIYIRVIMVENYLC